MLPLPVRLSKQKGREYNILKLADKEFMSFCVVLGKYNIDAFVFALNSLFLEISSPSHHLAARLFPTSIKDLPADMRAIEPQRHLQGQKRTALIRTFSSGKRPIFPRFDALLVDGRSAPPVLGSNANFPLLEGASDISAPQPQVPPSTLIALAQSPDVKGVPLDVKIRRISLATRDAALTLGLLLLSMSLLYAGYCDFRLKEANMVLGMERQRIQCRGDYQINVCDNAVPALKGLCKQWELCAQADDKRVGRLVLMAEVVADAINALAGGMTWQAGICIVVCTFAFAAGRTQARHLALMHMHNEAQRLENRAQQARS
ncbi:hypothetical protein CYLTODRAFT_459005 [Cylindrobasidium torrendii FP15055 ss-10]|uniref:Brl1/Brr6 domain-containing protein n=1 Tax=Cylindrobasidium torrendii FP15055 ss-10 TaxID=1314674 RepID=A0A0D7AYS6_9AGAR|nr:hypothetical protein CYLTODRAFT_459005 [Cylindrobasidium torrendii FP15055 ss-10]